MSGYQKFPFQFASRGLQSRYVLDYPPDPHTYLNMMNMESREENTLSSRYGYRSITNNGVSETPLPDKNIRTLARLKSISENYRYAGADNNLYRRAGDTNGAFTKINGSSPLSGHRFASATYRPDFSSTPYIFFADDLRMMKDNGLLSAVQLWGIFAPQTPPTGVISAPLTKTVNLCEDHTQWTPTNFNGALTDSALVNTTLGTNVTAGTLAEVTPASMIDILPAMMLQIGGTAETVFVVKITDTTFTAFFVNAHITTDTVKDSAVAGQIPNGAPVATQQICSMVATASLDLTTFGSVPITDNDLISMFSQIDVPESLVSITLNFDVGTAGDPVPFLSYYTADIPAPSQTDTLAGVVIPRGRFTAVGQAGQATHDWSQVKRVEVVFVTQPNTTTNIKIDNIIVFGNGPSSIGGVGYDYRITYFNINTGAESSPSSPWVDSLWLEPTQQPIVLTLPVNTANPLNNDSQITHVRIYRRGGTLPSGWHLISQLPIATTSFTDDVPDSVAVIGNLLQLDNDPPVSSLLPTPVNATIAGGTVGPTSAGSNATSIQVDTTVNMSAGQYITVDDGVNQEQSIVVEVTNSTHFKAYLQLAHATGAMVTASVQVGKPVSICVNAFNQMWCAGDSANPHFLYYSKFNRPESFAPQNYIEVGTPSDPIMALIPFNGQLYLFTLTTAYLVIPPGLLGSTVPYAQPTRCKHGLVGRFAWTVTEGEIIYASYDGFYAFQAGEGALLSEIVDWIPKGLFLGPVPPMAQDQRANTLMAYANRETFVSYVDVNGNTRRIVWSSTYKRWRPDSIPASAMYFEADTATFLFAKYNGMIYRDRTGDFDDGGMDNGVVITDPITLGLQTNSDDQKAPNNPKVYNEVTIDIDTNGQFVNVSLLFDNQGTTLLLGSAFTTARKQLTFAINGGSGYESLNVALLIDGPGVIKVLTLYGAYIKATIEPELRLSWDTFWTDMGDPEWKEAKQGYFVYKTSGNDPIHVSAFFEGSSTAAFTFDLPASTDRVSKWIKFPNLPVPLKYKLMRLTGVSDTPFQLWGDTFVEYKKAAQGKGYLKWAPIEQVSAS